jgi:hypothetical protein
MKSTNQLWAELEAARETADRLSFIERLTDLGIAILHGRAPMPVGRDGLFPSRTLVQKDEGPRDLEMELAGMVRAANEVHSHLARLFRSCAPQCEVSDNTAHLVNQLDNVIAGYRIRLGFLIRANGGYPLFSS